jgi:hypothetical protein
VVPTVIKTTFNSSLFVIFLGAFNSVPFLYVVVTLLLPKTTVFEPKPKASLPITIWFVSPIPFALELKPMKIESFIMTFVIKY